MKVLKKVFNESHKNFVKNRQYVYNSDLSQEGQKQFYRHDI